MKTAICIGHNSKNKGAFSLYLNQNEYDYNTRIANLVSKQLPNTIEVFNRYQDTGYNKEIENLSKRVNRSKFDLVMELHFNAAIPQANGCEALYFHKSKLGKQYAESFCNAVNKEYKTVNRGSKPLFSDVNRGFGFVQKINTPAIILEPFFGSNLEAQLFINAQRYADTIVKWINCL